MISNRAKRIGLKELEIFDNFFIDKTLPKFKMESTNNKADMGGVSWSTPSEGGVTDSGNWENDSGGFSFRRKLISLLSPKDKKPKQPKRTLTTLELFTALSKSYKELSKIGEVAEHYEKALIQAKTLGQTALFDKLKDLVDVVKGEAILIAMGLTKYVTEKQIVDFYGLVGEDKNLKLTWIKNFNRIIPEDIYEVKKDVDGRKIFDNYVILHYDPENNGEELTKQELEDKKDPILFGLIKDSKKLYYVADWKDDYCDLTLEEMFNELGEKTLKINNRNVKTFIDKIK